MRLSRQEASSYRVSPGPWGERPTDQILGNGRVRLAINFEGARGQVGRIVLEPGDRVFERVAPYAFACEPGVTVRVEWVHLREDITGWPLDYLVNRIVGAYLALQRRHLWASNGYRPSGAGAVYV